MVRVGGICSGIPAGAVVVWEIPPTNQRENANRVSPLRPMEGAGLFESMVFERSSPDHSYHTQSGPKSVVRAFSHAIYHVIYGSHEVAG